MNQLSKKLKFDYQGLICAVVQHAQTKQVLMVAYMNKAALKATLKTGLMHFYSRSRKKLWLKGEHSGNLQKVKKVFFDCDADCLLFQVMPKGAACHNGFYSCFYRQFAPKSKKVKIIAKPVFDPRKVYKH
jgi:phosphoribosyl-AMP cyclohydrolase